MQICVLYKTPEGEMQADYYQPNDGLLYAVNAQRRFDFLQDMGYEMHSKRPQAKGLRRIQARNIKEGQWIVTAAGQFNQRVVEVTHGPMDHQVKVHHDFGNGGEPATSLYWHSDPLLVFDPQ